MSQILFANNAATTIASAISAVATSVTLASGTGALYPSPGTNQYFKATMYPATAGTQAPEIVHVTARSSDTLTIVRAQEGTAAQSWGSGAVFDNLITAGTLSVLPQQVTYAGNPNGFVAGATGTSTIPPSQVWDTTNGLIWVCTTSGPAATAGWSALAPLNSPAFTGNPTAATQLSSDNSTRLATTAFVHNYAAPVAGNASQAFSVANAGSSSQAIALGQMASSVGASGYQKFPGGLIMQWAKVYVDTGGSTWTYPIPFPTAAVSVVGTPITTTASTDDVLWVESVTNVSCYFDFRTTQVYDIYAIALGY